MQAIEIVLNELLEAEEQAFYEPGTTVNDRIFKAENAVRHSINRLHEFGLYDAVIAALDEHTQQILAMTASHLDQQSGKTSKNYEQLSWTSKLTIASLAALQATNYRDAAMLARWLAADWEPSNISETLGAWSKNNVDLVWRKLFDAYEIARELLAAGGCIEERLPVQALYMLEELASKRVEQTHKELDTLLNDSWSKLPEYDQNYIRGFFLEQCYWLSI